MKDCQSMAIIEITVRRGPENPGTKINAAEIRTVIDEWLITRVERMRTLLAKENFSTQIRAAIEQYLEARIEKIRSGQAYSVLAVYNA